MAEFPCGNLEKYSSLAEAMAVEESRLQTKRPLVFVRQALPGWSLEKTIDAYLMSFGRWSKVADVKTRLITDMAEAGPKDVVNEITVADLGGGGVLADQQLPNGSSRILRMRMNSRLKWIMTDGPMTGGMDAVRVFCHEQGHFLSHSHWPRGAPAELMEPFISDDIIAPQPTEAAMTAQWFGQPAPGPDPQPTPTPDPTNPCPTICQAVNNALGVYNRIRRSGGLTVANFTLTNEQINALASAAATIPCDKITQFLLSLMNLCPQQPAARAIAPCAGLAGLVTLIQTLGPLIQQLGPICQQFCPQQAAQALTTPAPE